MSLSPVLSLLICHDEVLFVHVSTIDVYYYLSHSISQNRRYFIFTPSLVDSSRWLLTWVIIPMKFYGIRSIYFHPLPSLLRTLKRRGRRPPKQAPGSSKESKNLRTKSNVQSLRLQVLHYLHPASSLCACVPQPNSLHAALATIPQS